MCWPKSTEVGRIIVLSNHSGTGWADVKAANAKKGKPRSISAPEVAAEMNHPAQAYRAD